MTTTKSIFDAFKTDGALVSEGVWLDFGEYGRIKVAAAGPENQSFRSALQRTQKPYLRQIQTGTLPDSKDMELLAEVYAAVILRDWELIDKDGKPIPFSKAAAKQLLLDLPRLFQAIRDEAGTIANFRVEAIEEVVKN